MAINLRTVPHKASNFSKSTFGIYFSRMDEVHRSASSRKAYRSLVTCLIEKIEELTGNGTISTVEEPQLTDLIAAVEHLESKSSILLELDTKVAQAMVAQAITDPEELEGDIYQAIEIQDSISEYTRRAMRITNHSERPQPPTAPPLNVNATPYQPSQGNLPNTSEEQVDPPLLRRLRHQCTLTVRILKHLRYHLCVSIPFPSLLHVCPN